MKIGLILLLGFVSMSVSAQVLNESQRTARLDSLIHYIAEKYHFNGTVVLAQKDHIIYERTIGMADKERNIPLVKESKFRLGSISKQFTAFVILQLCEQGRMRLDDSVSTYLSAFRNTDKKGITIRNLLTHTSGLADYTNLKRFNEQVPYSSDSLLGMIVQARLRFQTGTTFQYCNSNYYLLSLAAEKVAGKRFGLLLKEMILTPAGMKNTGEEPEDTPITHLSKPYMRNGDSVEPGPQIAMKNTQGGGGMYSTAKDLLLWSLFFQRRLAASAFLKKAITTFLLPGDSVSLYSCGWSLTPGVLFHTGHINGFANLIAIDTARKQTYIFLTNTDYRQLYISMLTARHIMDDEALALDWIAPREGRPLEDYAGTYSIGRLQVEVKPQYPDLAGYIAGNKDLLTIFFKDEFFFKDREGLVRFNRDAMGKVISLSSFQDYEWVDMKKTK